MMNEVLNPSQDLFINIVGAVSEWRKNLEKPEKTISLQTDNFQTLASVRVGSQSRLLESFCFIYQSFKPQGHHAPLLC